MRISRITFFLVMVLLLTATVNVVGSEDMHARKVGAYLVVEGKVTHITARMLVIDGQQYPISMFAQVFIRDLKGPESSIQTVVNIGRIDEARLYILGGKVQKIIVLKNL